MLAAGTLVTVTVKGSAAAGWGMDTKTDVLNKSVAEIGNIPLTVQNSTIDQGLLDTVYNAATGHWFHYDYVATVTVSVPGDTYDDDTEVGWAVSGAFEDVTGQSPSAVQTSIVGAAPPITSTSDVLGSVAGAVTGELNAALLVVAGLVVLLIVALAWGKNIPALATVHV